MSIGTHPDNTVTEKLGKLAELYKQGEVSPMVTRTLDKLLAYETEECQRQLGEVNADLSAFEQKYGLASEEFYQQFRAGQTDDRMDFVEWASLIQMAQNLRERLDLLTGKKNV